MKEKYKDVTFVLLVRIDSIQRLENTLLVVNMLHSFFDTNIILREASSFNNRILETLLKRKVSYEFLIDNDIVLHKTMHFNEMIVKYVSTPYLAIWDVDIVPDRKSIVDCVNQLRNNLADVAYPYNGYCYNVSEIFRELFLKIKDIRLLYRHQKKLNLLYSDILVGGAIFLSKETFIYSGMENEKIYGWGDDDFYRYYKYNILKLRVHRTNTSLFHLWHPRGENSSYINYLNKEISKRELALVLNLDSICK